MSRKRRSKGRKPSRTQGRPLSLSITGIEFARGADGFLRGLPEPAMIFALYSGGATTRLITRLIVEVPMHDVQSFPVTVVLPDRQVLSTAVPPDGPLLLLGLGVEIDSRDLLQQLYAWLEQPDRFHAWRVSDETPAPIELAQLARSEATPDLAAERYRLMWDDRDLEDVGAELGDTYVGAAGVVLGAPLGGHRNYRMHFSSSRGDNDWTALVSVGAG